ncbi:MAG: 2-keto-4-pentenoate hydratase [Jiangellaceae bacterium]
MLALQRQRLRAGDRRFGWKAGFGSPTALKSLGTDRPLVGFLTTNRVIEPGATVSVTGWTKPLYEAEFAVHMARDVPPGASADDVRSAIGGVSAAVELVDVDHETTDVARILAGNVFHRHVMIGPVDPTCRDLERVSVRVVLDDEEVDRTFDPEAMTGPLVDVVGSIADTLQRSGDGLAAGDVVITGSIFVPREVAAGQRLRAEFTGLGSLEVELT